MSRIKHLTPDQRAAIRTEWLAREAARRAQQHAAQMAWEAEQDRQEERDAEAGQRQSAQRYGKRGSNA